METINQFMDKTLFSVNGFRLTLGVLVVAVLLAMLFMRRK